MCIQLDSSIPSPKCLLQPFLTEYNNYYKLLSKHKMIPSALLLVPFYNGSGHLSSLSQMKFR